MLVIKRDGRKVRFDETKIKKAISSAFKSTKEVLEDGMLDILTTDVKYDLCGLNPEEISEEDLDMNIRSDEGQDGERQVEVDTVQNSIEQVLMKRGFGVTAKAFILYREERSKERSKRSHIFKEMQEKLSCKNIENQNANVDEHSFGGRKGEASSIWHKNNALEYMMSPKFAKNHKQNRIYIHDLDSYDVGMHNCLSIPFDDLLRKGFTTRQTDIRPASSINTAFQLVAVIFQLQSLQQYGGVSATHLDWTMVPYVRKSFFKHYVSEIEDHKPLAYKKFMSSVRNILPENISIEDTSIYKNLRTRKIALKKTIKETLQAVEGMYHNLNTLQSRSGNQLPFTSINYGTCTLPEGRMVIDALLEGSLRGVGKFHKTPIFPCGIFQYSVAINGEKGTPNYDLFKKAIKSTSKRLYPNYCNIDWSNDKDWSDIEFKEKFLSSLSKEDYDTLALRLRNNFDAQVQLGLNVEEIKEKKFFFSKPKLTGKFKITPAIVWSAAPSTMGCRTYTSKDVTWEEDYTTDVKSFIADENHVLTTFASSHMKDGRGNISPATIILPTLAMEAKKKADKNGHPEYIIDEFMSILETAISDCKDELIERFEWICAQPASSAAFMYDNNTFYGYKPEEGIKSALRHGSLAIGQLGLAECLQILVGCDHTEKKGMEVAKQIEQLFKDKCAEYKNNYKLNFGVYYTPAENLCYTAMKNFKKKYGVIENVSTREYFTNSMHVPVWKEISPFEKIDIESQLTGYSGAGCITYTEFDADASKNLSALEKVVRYAMSKDIPYFAVNLPSDTCLCCGYQGDLSNGCPQCGNKDENLIEFLRRVTGYLTGSFKKAFNAGKIAETLDRYKHSKKMQQS